VSNRIYTSRRMSIVDALVDKFKSIMGTFHIELIFTLMLRVDFFFGMRLEIFQLCMLVQGLKLDNIKVVATKIDF